MAERQLFQDWNRGVCGNGREGEGGGMGIDNNRSVCCVIGPAATVGIGDEGWVGLGARAKSATATLFVRLMSFHLSLYVIRPSECYAC